MTGIGRLLLGLILAIVLFGARAEAQDSSLMDMNMDMGCMLMAGMHEMRVSAYQQSSDASEDYCEGIPSPGPVSITLNALSKELRDMTMEIRIVRDTGGNLAPNANLDPITLAYLAPKNYPTGVVTFPANLDKPGQYAILVTVRDDKDKDMVMSGRFVMTVEQTFKKWLVVPIVFILALAAVLASYIWEQRRKKLSVKSG